MESPAEQQKVPFFRSRSFGIVLVWALLLSASIGTYKLSHSIESRDQNLASVFSGAGDALEVGLFKGRAEPSSVVAREGEEVVFVVRDESIHNIAEEREKKTDARLVSGELRKDESYSLVFRTKGEYSFYDRLNQDIRVTITVK